MDSGKRTKGIQNSTRKNICKLHLLALEGALGEVLDRLLGLSHHDGGGSAEGSSTAGASHGLGSTERGGEGGGLRNGRSLNAQHKHLRQPPRDPMPFTHTAAAARLARPHYQLPCDKPISIPAPHNRLVVSALAPILSRDFSTRIRIRTAAWRGTAAPARWRAGRTHTWVLPNTMGEPT